MNTMVQTTRFAAVIEVKGPSGRLWRLRTPLCATERFASHLAGGMLPKIDGRAQVLDVRVLPERDVPANAMEVRL